MHSIAKSHFSLVSGSSFLEKNTWKFSLNGFSGNVAVMHQLFSCSLLILSCFQEEGKALACCRTKIVILGKLEPTGNASILKFNSMNSKVEFRIIIPLLFMLIRCNAANHLAIKFV